MFKQAIPVFAKGRENELNYTLLLRGECADLRGCKLYVSAASFYRLAVNGRFVAFGPARTALGYARVDEIALGRYHRKDGKNEIVIEVAGYACKSLSTVKQPSFAIAELCRGEEVVLATGRDFEGYASAYRVQKCDRYSGQRHFSEVWDLGEQHPFGERYAVELAEVKSPVFLPRVAPYPTYEVVESKTCSSRGRFAHCEPENFRPYRYSFEMIKDWGCFDESEVGTHPYRFVQKQKIKHERTGKLPVTLSAGEYVMFDMKQIHVGFFEWSAKVLEDCELVLAFSELCDPKKFAFTNMNVQNVIEYRVPEGREVCTGSFEPYTARLVILMVKKGALHLSRFAIRLFEHDRSRVLSAKVKDPVLRRIRKAAETTFVHNALDLYSDCPSRERAGWLCDSFFTGRAEYFLTGKTTVEDAFLENYRLYPYNGELPKGALPECYPADIRYPEKMNGRAQWIPQWNLWYVLEVCEYLTARRPDVDKEIFRESVYGVLNLFATYENKDGLLQNLPSWNFVEWSTANEWVQDVNYPTNFLYAGVLKAAGELYGDAKLQQKAVHVREKTAQMSFDGEVFIDNALLGEDGVLHNTRNSSEAGQYYAMLFGELELSDARYARLLQYLEDHFTSFDTAQRSFVPVNAFIGLYLRIWLLMRLGKRELLAQDLKSFFGGMVASTGTLWEYKQHKGSYDHGFASFAALAIAFAEGAELDVSF